MAVVVNNPQPQPASTGNNGLGVVVAIIVLLILAILFFRYGLPYLQGIGGTQVNIPDHVNVNVHQGK